jgi:hypothetical protein
LAGLDRQQPGALDEAVTWIHGELADVGIDAPDPRRAIAGVVQ